MLDGLGLRNKHRVKVYVAGSTFRLGALEPVKEGDQMVFTYVPGTGTTLAINGNDKITSQVQLSAECSSPRGWGLSQPNADLKKGILGQ